MFTCWDQQTWLLLWNDLKSTFQCKHCAHTGSLIGGLCFTRFSENVTSNVGVNMWEPIKSVESFVLKVSCLTLGWRGGLIKAWEQWVAITRMHWDTIVISCHSLHAQQLINTTSANLSKRLRQALRFWPNYERTQYSMMSPLSARSCFRTMRSLFMASAPSIWQTFSALAISTSHVNKHTVQN